MGVAKTTTDGLTQIRILAEHHVKVHEGKYDGMKLSELADRELAAW